MKHKKGETIIELAAAAAIMSIICLPIAALQKSSYDCCTSAQKKTKTALLAQNVMEWYKSKKGDVPAVEKLENMIRDVYGSMSLLEGDSAVFYTFYNDNGSDDFTSDYKTTGNELVDYPLLNEKADELGICNFQYYICTVLTVMNRGKITAISVTVQDYKINDDNEIRLLSLKGE